MIGEFFGARIRLGRRPGSLPVNFVLEAILRIEKDYLWGIVLLQIEHIGRKHKQPRDQVRMPGLAELLFGISLQLRKPQYLLSFTYL